MLEQNLHTPDGVRDIYNSECDRKLILQDKLFEIIRSYGYAPIQTPSFEFFDVFGKEVGTTPSKDLYKFFDRDGNTLVLRPDITPSIARAAAKYYKDETIPVRFSYCGNTFTNNSEYQGRLKETTQLGAELVGECSVDADAEIIALTAECFLKAGLKEFQISVNDCRFFKALCKTAGLDEETVSLIRDDICSKNYFAAIEVLRECGTSDESLAQFEALSGFMGGVAMLDRASEYVSDIPEAINALDSLRELYEVLKDYGCENYISFDLGLLSKYDYYTGILFDGYTFGSGEAVAKGGRYDELISHFGKNAPAVGCVVMLDQLLLALSRQKIETDLGKRTMLVIYPANERKKAIALGIELRKEGKRVELMRRDPKQSNADYETFAERNNLQLMMLS